jgi:hypothetical protein
MKQFYKSCKVILLALFLTGSLMPGSFVQAQHFEGVLMVEMTDNAGENEKISLFIKENRLRFVGALPGGNEMVPVTGESVLLRADHKDLIIFGEDNTAIQLKFQELEMLMNMLGAQNNETEVEEPSTVQVNHTNEAKQIAGYNAKRTVITDTETPGNELHMWLTDELNINWEQMAGAFGSLGETLGINNLSDEFGWQMDKTPVLIEFYEDGKLESSIKIKEVISRSLSKSEIDVPDGYTLTSFFQMMMGGQ